MKFTCTFCLCLIAGSSFAIARNEEKHPTVYIPRNIAVLAFPNAREWNCSDQAPTHPCKKPAKRTKR